MNRATGIVAAELKIATLNGPSSTVETFMASTQKVTQKVTSRIVVSRASAGTVADGETGLVIK